jgi:hypothetical protein
MVAAALVVTVSVVSLASLSSRARARVCARHKRVCVHIDGLHAT